jgi:membrane protein DedA with SNARE-associated domain
MISPLATILSVCFLGSGALVPIMYAGVREQASLGWIFASATIGLLILDIIWYFLAQKLGAQRVEKWWIARRKPERFKMIESAVQKHGAKILFWSKLIHGVGIPSQLVAGLFKVPFKKFLAANIFGAMVWVTIVYFLAKSIASVDILKSKVVHIEIGFIIFIATFLILNTLATRFIKKYIKKLSGE